MGIFRFLDNCRPLTSVRPRVIGCLKSLCVTRLCLSTLHWTKTDTVCMNPDNMLACHELFMAAKRGSSKTSSDDKNGLLRHACLSHANTKWNDCSEGMHMISLKSLGSLFSAVKNQTTQITEELR